VLNDFYNPFSKDLEKAESNMKSTKGEDAQRTTYKCKECKRTLVIRWGRNGPFLGCEGFFDKENKCSFTAEMNEDGTMKEIPSGPIEGADFEGSPIYLKNGRYGYYFETETGIRAALPRTVKPEEVTPEIAAQTIADKMKGDEPVCELETGETVYFKVGRYGPYYQVVKDEEKRNIALPRNYNKEEATEEEIAILISLPKPIGDHPDTGEEITLNFGKYGGFVKSGDKTHSIGSLPLGEVDVEKAVELLAKPKKKKKRSAKKKS
jgi:topoisomerase IA-like protein